MSLKRLMGGFLILVFSLAPCSGQTQNQNDRLAINAVCTYGSGPKCVGRDVGVGCGSEYTPPQLPQPQETCRCHPSTDESPKCLSLLNGDCLLGQTATSCISSNMTCEVRKQDPNSGSPPEPLCTCSKDQDISNSTYCGPNIPRDPSKTHTKYFGSAPRRTSQVFIAIGMTGGSLLFSDLWRLLTLSS